MQGPGHAEPDGRELARLSAVMKVLASPTRLRVLAALRVPKRASELRIPAEEDRGGLQSERLLSRTTLIEHLDVLQDAGLVERLPGDAGFVVNQQNVFAMVEALGKLARIRPVVEVDVETTRPQAKSPASAMPEGPRLVLAHGPREGHAFGLAGPGPWIVGRSAEADVRLDYDPHVSRQQVVVRRDRAGYTVEALRDSTNPSQVNFRELVPGQPVALPAGAVLAVGASRLVLQTG